MTAALLIPPATMRAVRTSRYGAPDVLTLVEVPRPAPRPDEVLVDVHASAVTQGDRRLRAGDFPGMHWLPARLAIGLVRPRHAIQGTTFAGRVAAAGSSVTRFAVGDDVFGIQGHGAYAESLVVRETGAIARAPAGLDAAHAAALPYGATTALTFVRDLGRVQRGERVAIVGASGEVGRAAIQIARHLGAEVTGACSREHAMVSELGAHEVVDTRALTVGGRRFDVIFDAAPASRFELFRSSLTARGRYLTLHMTLGILLRMAAAALLGRDRRAITGVAMPSEGDLCAVRDLVEAGALRPVIARRFPLADAAAAHALLETGDVRGSVIVEVRTRSAIGPSSGAAARARLAR